MTIRALLFASAAGLVLSATQSVVAAERYTSLDNRFAITISPPWEQTRQPDPTAELFLLCSEAACGPKVLLSVGALFDPNLRNGALSDFLDQVNGKIITRDLWKFAPVAHVSIVREGRTILGATEAYEVLSEITLRNGQKRMRYTLMTFNAGFVYSMNLGFPPEGQAKALSEVKKVLSTFQFK